MEDRRPAHSTDRATGRRIIAEGSTDSLANPDYTGEPFTAFETVGPDTDLAALNLNWRERDLPERLRTKHVHRLHPYLGKYIPQLVEIFLRKFQPRLVCDPFVGSGTTLVEAAALGIPSFGVDVSPFNCLLSKVKTDAYDLPRLKREVHDILDRSLLDPGDAAQHELQPTPYLSDWFSPRALQELLSYCALIPEYEYAEVLKIILSRAARSARMVPHHELDFPKEPQRTPYECRKHHRTCRPTAQARRFLVRYSREAVERIGEFAALRRAPATVVCGDAREVEFPAADLLLTSPPYVGLIDYHEQHRYAYELLSLLPEPFASVGYRGAQPLGNARREIGPASRGASRARQEQYVADIQAALARAIEPLRPGAHTVIVVNDRHGLYGEVAAALPVEAVATLNRHVNRRTGRRSGAFYEQALIWRRVGSAV